jgi:hypothetical protein
MQDADTIVAQAQNAIMRSVRPDTLGTKGRFWREAAVRAWDELATEDLARPVDATHLQHDQLKLLKLLN